VIAAWTTPHGPALLAHQGGWDEVLMIGVPIAAIIALLWLAKRRVERITGGGRAD